MPSEFYKYGYSAARGGMGKHTNPAKDSAKKAEWDRGWEDGKKDKAHHSSQGSGQEYKMGGAHYKNGQQKALNEIQNKAAAVGIKLKNLNFQITHQRGDTKLALGDDGYYYIIKGKVVVKERIQSFRQALKDFDNV